MFWLCWVFIALCGLSLVAASQGHSSLQCAGFLLQWLLLLQSTGSRHMDLCSCGVQVLAHGLSSCGAWAELLSSMWHLLKPGIEPMPPALAGRFLSTVPLGKSCFIPFHVQVISEYLCHERMKENKFRAGRDRRH